MWNRYVIDLHQVHWHSIVTTIVQVLKQWVNGRHVWNRYVIDLHQVHWHSIVTTIVQVLKQWVNGRQVYWYSIETTIVQVLKQWVHGRRVKQDYISCADIPLKQWMTTLRLQVATIHKLLQTSQQVQVMNDYVNAIWFGSSDRQVGLFNVDEEDDWQQQLWGHTIGMHGTNKEQVQKVSCSNSPPRNLSNLSFSQNVYFENKSTILSCFCPFPFSSSYYVSRFVLSKWWSLPSDRLKPVFLHMCWSIYWRKMWITWVIWFTPWSETLRACLTSTSLSDVYWRKQFW